MAWLTPEQVRATVEAAGVPVTDEDLEEITLRANAMITALGTAPEPPPDIVPFPILVWEDADDA